VTNRVGIVGIGYEGFKPAVTDLPTREIVIRSIEGERLRIGPVVEPMFAPE
jgi:hypothetical protein